MALNINKYSDTIVLFTILGLLLIIFLFILFKNKKEGFGLKSNKAPPPSSEIKDPLGYILHVDNSDDKKYQKKK